jgi:hypothetical protein
MRLAMEKDLETARQAALLLEAESRKLVAKNLELQTELLKLKGLGVEQLALHLTELEQQLAARNKMIFGSSSEKRNKRPKGSAEKPQKGHGPTEQPKLRLIEDPVELGDVATTCCPHCKGTVAEWVGQFEESEEIDVISRELVRRTIKRKKARCECNRTIVTAPVPPSCSPVPAIRSRSALTWSSRSMSITCRSAAGQDDEARRARRRVPDTLGLYLGHGAAAEARARAPARVRARQAGGRRGRDLVAAHGRQGQT